MIVGPIYVVTFVFQENCETFRNGVSYNHIVLAMKNIKPCNNIPFCTVRSVELSASQIGLSRKKKCLSISLSVDKLEAKQMVNNKFLPFKDSCESVLLSKQMHPQPNAPVRTLFLGAMAMLLHEHLGGQQSKPVPYTHSTAEQ